MIKFAWGEVIWIGNISFFSFPAFKTCRICEVTGAILSNAVVVISHSIFLSMKKFLYLIFEVYHNLKPSIVITL